MFPSTRKRGPNPLAADTFGMKQQKYMGLYKAARVGDFPDVTDPATDRNPWQFRNNAQNDSPTSWVTARNPRLLGMRGLEQWSN
jgi:hypothetical protein